MKTPKLPLLPKAPKGEADSAPDHRPKKIWTMLLDSSIPLEMRVEILQQLASAADEAAVGILARLIEAAGATTAEEQHAEKLREVSALLGALQQGPLRCALFDRMLEQPELGRRAQVILPDGTLASPLVTDEELAGRMRCGDTVWLDGKGSTILYHAPTVTAIGDEARLERVLEGGHVEVSVGELGRSVHRASSRLLDQLEKGEAEPGSTVIVCQRRMMAFMALPSAAGLDHYEFLSRESVPDVVVERDMGAPPAFIGQLSDHLRRELDDPGVSTRYRLRSSKLSLLSGIPGSGKTFGIHAFWNAMYATLSEVTGVPVEELPPRVMRLRASEVLSKWLGGSDKQIARFFKEVDQLAAQPWAAPDGRTWRLPVLVIAEEIDALARSRGEDGVHDRIMATLLEGLDPSRPVYRDHLVFLIATTNTSHLVDMAVIRRIGGRIETFGHMDRFTFRAVLEKHLRDLPFRRGDAESADAARRWAIANVTSWLYGPNASARGQIEVTFVGQANPVTKHHRDFLTAGLIDRAIQEACEEAANAEHAGAEDPGLTVECVIAAIDRQVRHIVDLLTPHNCGQYLALPDGERVATLRRIEQPASIPFELERAS
ncbi:MAG: AAA family ATPase [Deltaproteobacteria bacterium]|nr:AAA family ATPase [Deltaproteobacteria bacterium]MBW2420138.1 AAA family ATPase [Deltaproteobacteria bacterium]